MESKKEIKPVYYYPIILLLFAYLIFRLIDTSQIIKFFPLGKPSDIPTYMGYLFALAKVGYYNLVPYWFNSQLLLFQHYAPGLFFFSLPLYYITKDVKISLFIMILILYLIIFISIWIFGKKTNITATKRIVFYLILMANPFAIGNFIRLGRVVELFGWTLLIILSLLMIYFVNKPFNKFFPMIFIPAYSILMISHPAIATFFHITLLPLSLFYLTSRKGKMALFFSMLIGLAISSFWWVPFLLSTIKQSAILSKAFTIELIRFDNLSFILTNISSIIISIILFFTFFIFWKSNHKKKKDLIFFLPVLLINFLVLTRLIIFIPLLKNIFPDIYHIFFIFFIMIFFIKIDFNRVSNLIKTLIKITLILTPIIFILVSLLHTPLFMKHTVVEEEVIDLLKEVKGKYFMLESPYQTSHPPLYYVYGAIYLNLSTPAGSPTFGVMNKNYSSSLRIPRQAINENNCPLLLKTLDSLEIHSIVAYYERDCDFLKTCGLNLKKEGDYACLYINPYN